MSRAGCFLAMEAAMSLVAYFVYALDKRRARRNEWRVRERTLLLLAFFGGAPGALLAMRRLRHKTQHGLFRLLVPLFLILQGAELVYFLL